MSKPNFYLSIINNKPENHNRDCRLRFFICNLQATKIIADLIILSIQELIGRISGKKIKSRQNF